MINQSIINPNEAIVPIKRITLSFCCSNSRSIRLGLVAVLLLLPTGLSQPGVVAQTARDTTDVTVSTEQLQATGTNALNPSVLEALDRYALSLVNQSRQSQQRAPLRLDPLLKRAAQNHAEDMAQRNYFQHTSPEGTSPTKRYAAVGGQGGAGENIVFIEGISSYIKLITVANLLHQIWLKSPHHRDNLLTERYRWFGYGYAVDSRRHKIYAVQMFR
jgi:uncharacterized protein YkwD